MPRWLLVVGLVAIVLVLLALVVYSGRGVDVAGGALLAAGGGSNTAERTDPQLWDRIVKKVKEGSDYGLAGKWNARKAQHAVRLYKDAGGGYKGKKRRDNSLARWTREDWGYVSDGDRSSRYLPKRVRDSLTPAEKAATNRAKREKGRGASVEWLSAEKRAMKRYYPYNVGGTPILPSPAYVMPRAPAKQGGGSRRQGKTVHVHDKMQKSYSYKLTAEPGKSLSFVYPKDAGQLAGVRLPFKPQVTPAAMLKRGVFEGKYMNDCRGEFPAAWYADAEKADKLRPKGADPTVNEFGIKSRLSLKEWRKRGWIPITKHPRLSKEDRAYVKALGKRDGKNYAGYDPDPRGWFQWYCRYWAGRRDEVVDPLQIKRWRSFVRHVAQVRDDPKNPKGRAAKKVHRPRQRQALLQWAYNPYV